MATLLIMLFVTLAPATVLLVTGTWLVKKRHGDVSFALGFAFIVLGLMLVVILAPLLVFLTPTTVTMEP